LNVHKFNKILQKKNAMQGRSDQEKLDMAWGLYGRGAGDGRHPGRGACTRRGGGSDAFAGDGQREQAAAGPRLSRG
jgi:hypothetical protein